MSSKVQLTPKATDVLNILLASPTPLTASQIANMDDQLNINTIQNVLRSLMKAEYISVADIVYSGTVLCRCYTTTPKAQLECVQTFAAQFDRLHKVVPLPTIFSALLDVAEDRTALVREFEKLVQLEKKK